MKTGRFALSLAAAALVACAPARAAEGVAAQSGNWTIGPIAGSNLCSMKNTYANGHMLVFGRGPDGAGSLAIDYGSKALQAGHQYPAALDLPPLLSRNLTAVAATDSVLLLNLGTDKALSGALAGMEALYVTALKTETGYSLSGSADALRELSECAASSRAGGKPYAAAEAAPAKKTVVASPAGRTEDQLLRLKAENKVLARENAAIKAAAVAAEVGREELEAAKKTAAAHEAARAKLESEIARLKENLDAASATEEGKAALEKEIAALKSELASARAAGSRAETLEDEIRRLKSALAGAESKTRAEDRDSARAKALEDEVRNLKSALAKAQAARNEAVPGGRIAALEAENARLRKTAAPPPPSEKESRIAGILKASGIVPAASLSPRISGGAQSWRWESGGLFGAAEEVKVPSGRFADRVTGYFARMASLCTGDFAKTEDEPLSKNGVTLQKAEMACIDDESDAAAALLFVGDGSTFTVITQEGSTAQMETALEKRNAVANSVF